MAGKGLGVMKEGRKEGKKAEEKRSIMAAFRRERKIEGAEEGNNGVGSNHHREDNRSSTYRPREEQSAQEERDREIGLEGAECQAREGGTVIANYNSWTWAARLQSIPQVAVAGSTSSMCGKRHGH